MIKNIFEFFNLTKNSFGSNVFGLTANDFHFLHFELFFFLSIIVLLIFFVWVSNKKTKNSQYVSCTDSLINVLFFIIATLFFILNNENSINHELLNNYYSNDEVSIFFKNVSLFFLTMYLFALKKVLKLTRVDFEFVILLFISFYFGILILNANDLIVLFFLVEAQSLCFYVMAASKQTSSFSTESGLKYFILGCVASGFMLFGISLIYGFSGLLSFSDIAIFLSTAKLDVLLQNSMVGAGLFSGFVMLCVGLFFKLGSAPFHFWMPDVYEGAPLVITTYLATVAKIPIVFIFLKIYYEVFFEMFHYLQHFLVIFALLSLIIGTFSSIYQTKIKRLLTYSIITNTGYILLGLSLGGIQGFWVTLIYLLPYTITMVGLFFCFISLEDRVTKNEIKNIMSLTNLAESKPILAFCISVLLFSLAGIPPFMGFYGKLFLFDFALKSGVYWVSVVIVIFSAISAYYYIKLIKLMYFNRSVNRVFYKEIPYSNAFIISFCTLINILFFIYPDLLVATAARIALLFFI